MSSSFLGAAASRSADASLVSLHEESGHGDDGTDDRRPFILDDFPTLARLTRPGGNELDSLAAVAQGGREQPLRIFCEAAEECLAMMVADPNAGLLQASLSDQLRTLRRDMKLLTVWPPPSMNVGIVMRPVDSGFFAAFLGVLDVLMLAPPGCDVRVDWTLTGHEKHFTYTPPQPGQCVWGALFEPIHLNAPPPSAAGAKQAFELRECRYNRFFRGHLKFALRTSRHNASQRRAYNEVIRRHVKLRHPAILAELNGLGAELAGGVSIGVHKRVDTPGTQEFQGLKAVLGTAEVIAAVRVLVERLGGGAQRVTRIFLATDDATAVAPFREAFGGLLAVREGVQRVAGGTNADGTYNEVHIASPHNPRCTIRDAVDVLTDAMLLAQCAHVVHMDSNVSTAVALLAPRAQMAHVADLLGREVPREIADVDVQREMRALVLEDRAKAEQAAAASRGGAA